MNKKAYVIQLLTSPQARLLITHDEYIAALLAYFPIGNQSVITSSDESKTYKECIAKEIQPITSSSSIPITIDFTSNEIEPGTLAYHRIKGLITADSWWYFSSKQLEQDLILAEENPNITCHFLHISSGGGEAWYLDRLSETMRSLSKPIYSFVEKVCGSAAYYIGCHGSIMKTLTQNDIIGCIGSMIGFWDIDPYFEAMGFRKIEEYARISDLKNKKYNDLKGGKPQQYIDEELEPLAEQFREEVRISRHQLASLDLDHPALRGETFDATHAIEVGLIDGIVTFNEALAEAYELGEKWHKARNQQRNRVLSLI